MKVYVFMIKRFFIENGTDYAAAIDDEETKVFSSLSSVCKYREGKYREIAGAKKDEIVKDFFCDRFWQIDFKDSSRISFQIIVKELEK